MDKIEKLQNEKLSLTQRISIYKLIGNLCMFALVFFTCIIFYYVDFRDENWIIIAGQKLIGSIGLLTSFCGVIFVYVAFLGQQLQNINYNIQFESQKETLDIQRFENSFFNLIQQYQQIVEGIDLKKNIYEIDQLGIKKKSKSGKKIIKERIIISTKRDCFRTMLFKLKSKLNAGSNDINTVMKEYDLIQYYYKLDLYHYFRFIYHILKFINSSDLEYHLKYKYSSILRATLSAHELVFIFYNGIHDNGNTHFKPLIEEYSFLKNLDVTQMVHSPYNEGKPYHPLAFASSENRAEFYESWKKEREKEKRKIVINNK